MSKLIYSYTIHSDILQETRTLKASTQEELRAKVAKTQAMWSQREQRLLERQAIADEKQRAELLTNEARALIEEYQSILKSTLLVNDQIDWEDLYNHRPFQATPYTERPPDIGEVMAQLRTPKPSFMETFWPPAKQKRLEAEERAQKELARQMSVWEQRKKEHEARIERAKAEFVQRQRIHNEQISSLKSAFEAGKAEAVERYFSMVLERSRYPEGLDLSSSVRFEPASGTAVVDLELPNPDQVPRITQYRFIQSRKVTETVEMKPKDFAAFYDSVIQQITLRTIHEMFESDYPRFLKSVVFNGWVSGVNPATGADFRACIVSCQTSREIFEPIDLSRVDPRECLRMLRAVVAGPLAQLAPVRPIMQMNTEDTRFVESRDILSTLDSSQNLATMPWEDFEHLVRELIGQVFSRDGGEVRVTQASRDGGVDAIAFDPTPVRGGKFVIQAKRYNNVVPVSAVRDLYGTVLNEGASKGILVTTSYFGHDSREFAKDKPLELIDGSNLVYMFQEHGHNVKIELTKSASQ